jgi:hypothetical protein
MQSAAKKLTTYRLTPAARKAIELLAGHLGLSRTGVVETAVRELQERYREEVSANASALQALRAMRTAARRAGIAT